MKWATNKRTKFFFPFFLFLIFTSIYSYAQRDVMLNQYWTMPSLYNPAMAGSSNLFEIGLGGRWQRAGSHDAPIMIVATGETPLTFLERKHGVGAVVSYEKVGVSNTTMIGFQYAFQMNLGEGKLHLALQPNIIFNGFNGSNYHPESDTIPASLPYPFENGEIKREYIPTGNILKKKFDITLGATYFYNDWYCGISFTHITEPTFNYSDSCEVKLPFNLYVMAGGKIKLNSSYWEIRPVLLFQKSRPLWRLDASLLAVWKKRFLLGIGYRHKEGVLGFLGVKIKDISLGYSYDHITAYSVKGEKGSHELTLRYNFELKLNKKRGNSVQSIRFL